MAHKRDSPTTAQETSQAYRNWDVDTTDTTSIGDLYESDDEPDPFVDLIQRDPVVCNSCFLLRYDVVTCEWWRSSFGWSDFEHWRPISDRSEPVPGDEPSHGIRLVCSNCGTSHDTLRPIPKDEITEHVENLSSTLRTKGIDHDPETLFSEVSTRNTSENQCKQDEEVFAPAVRKSIRDVQ